MATTEKSILNRLYLVAGVLFVFGLFVMIKLVNIQLVDGAYYREKAEQRLFKNFVIPANRGNLYDSNMNLLATSVPKYDVRFDAVTVKNEVFQENIAPLSEALSKEFGKSTAYYNKLLRKARDTKNRYVLIRGNMGYSQYMRLKNFPLFRLGANKGGFIVEQKTVREHPLGKIAERTVGYERQGVKGYYTRVGLEGAYGPYLSGKAGKRLKQKIAKEQWKPVTDDNEVEPKDGFDVISTIDVNMQDIVHHELLAQLKKYKAEHGTVVLMETKTGKIKAISNLGRNSVGRYYEKLNYAVGEIHEPGSTFKLMAMVAALEDKVIDSSSVVDTENGRVKFYDRTVYDSHWGGYGKISAAKAFELSSNTAFAKMIYKGYGHDPKKFLKRLYNMGLNKKLNLSIRGEGKPKFPYPGDEDWYGTTLPWMAFGYGVSLTPLQTLTFYNAIANDGEMVKPRFIKEIRAWDKVEQSFDKEVLNPAVCSKETAKIVQEMMANTVRRGTAKNIYNENFSMAGKTGTCQVEYWVEPGRYISSFAGYFPVDNPQYSCIVVIHKPKKELGYYGNIVAAPVFKKVAEKIFNDTPLVDEVSAQVTAHSVIKKSYARYNELSKTHVAILPDVIGMPAMDAIALLENMGLQVKVNGKGKVIKQSLKAGVKIEKHQKISLELS